VRKLLCVGLLFCLSLSAQEPVFLQWANGIAQAQLAQRDQTIAAIKNVGQAEARKLYVRQRILQIIGGLPARSGPLNAQVTGIIDQGTYHIEKVFFESLPGLRVSANVYAPNAAGRYPAVLVQIGHFPEAKAWPQLMAANLAAKGFVVIAFDPLGEGERQQGYNMVTRMPLINSDVGQHLMAGAQGLILGQNFGRYEIFDAMRAIDYLTSRADVDDSKIGATGCSGGGSLTYYTMVLEPRIKVAAPACVGPSYKWGIPLGAVGDSEQSFANFLSSGLDSPDFFEAFAPLPILLLNTAQDENFPPSASDPVFNEAKSFYSLYKASDKLQRFTGPGGHGMPLENRQALYAFMIQWLKGGKGDATELPLNVLPNDQLNVTANGYVGGLDIYQVIAATPRDPNSLEEMLPAVQRLIQNNHQAPLPQYGAITDLGSYVSQDLSFVTEPGLTISGKLLIPKAAGHKSGVLYVENAAVSSTAAQQLALGGRVVLDLFPRAIFPSVDPSDLFGDWVDNLLATLIGRNLPGMRAFDILRGVDILSGRADVDPARISGAASDIAGIWLLLASAVDTRLGAIALDHTPYSYKPAFASAIHRRLHDGALTGFYLNWDLGDLVAALGSRPISWANPTDWLGNVVPQASLAPVPSAAITRQAKWGPIIYLELTVTNAGPGAATAANISSLSYQTIAGSGSVIPISRAPIPIGDIAPGASRVIPIFLIMPSTLSKFSVTEGGTLKTQIGNSLTFSLQQSVTP